MDVMLVDDSRVMRQLVRRTLRQAGYEVGQVSEADNGAEALDKLATCRPDLVLSDWNMPTMDGFELLTQLRGAGNKVNFGFITSESTPAMRAKATSAGALFLLAKPFGPEDMRHILTAAGIEPATKIAGAECAPAAAVASGLDAQLVARTLESLVHVPVSVKAGSKLVPAAAPCLSMTWVDDDFQLRYAAFCEFALAAAFGSALSLRPAGWMAEQVKSKAMNSALQADTREVFNVLSRTFNDCGSVHVKLEEMSFPPASPLTVARAFDVRAASRLDLLVTVQGYASGKLSLVSASAHDFKTI